MCQHLYCCPLSPRATFPGRIRPCYLKLVPSLRQQHLTADKRDTQPNFFGKSIFILTANEWGNALGFSRMQEILSLLCTKVDHTRCCAHKKEIHYCVKIIILVFLNGYWKNSGVFHQGERMSLERSLRSRGIYQLMPDCRPKPPLSCHTLSISMQCHTLEAEWNREHVWIPAKPFTL